jgi:predicted kinase
VQSDGQHLVIVSGAPASGKTMLAERLSRDLQLPLIAKDSLKEALADAMGAPEGVAASGRMGDGAYAVLYAVAHALLEAGYGAIVESNFRRGMSEPELARLLPWAGARLIHCTAPPEVILARYAERFARGERHPAHLDAERADALRDDLDAGRFEPMQLPVPVLVVDTTDGWHPGYEEVREFAALPALALRAHALRR